MASNIDFVGKHFAGNWAGGKVTKLLKESQNCTYSGELSGGTLCVIRAVPKGSDQKQRLEVEVELLQFLAAHNATADPLQKLLATTIIPTTDGRAVVHIKEGDDDVLLLAFEYAPGRAVAIMSWEFMSNRSIAVAVGRAMGKFHNISKTLPAELRGKFRSWRELHDSLMADASVAPEDEAMTSDPALYGVTHSDINPSNFFLIAAAGNEAEAEGTAIDCIDVYLFDWDQVSTAWYAYDLAQTIHGALMLQWAGLMGMECTVQNLDEFINWTLEGYESATGTEVDRGHLKRMIALRRDFYLRFAARELANPTLPEGMVAFCRYVAEYGTKTQARFDEFMKSK